MRVKILLLFLFLSTAGSSAQQQLTVYFDFDQFDLNDMATNKIDSLLNNHKVEVTKIYGFCDWKGKNTYNDSLSLKRVATVFNYLKIHQVKVSDSYEIRGFGEDFKQSKVQSENRKVILVFESLKTEAKQPLAGEKGDSNLISQIKNAKTGDLIKLENINFFNMSPRILPKSKNVLQDLLCALEDNPNLRIEIQGHICCQTYDINSLSVMRARAVYNFLVINKINRKRLSFKGFGVTKPIHAIPERNEQEENDNRRVEIMILGN